MKKSHIALAVSNISTSAHEYSQRLGQPPDLIIPDHFALWPTATPNLPIRPFLTAQSQSLRHLGWEIEHTNQFFVEGDCHGIALECYTAQQQAEKIVQAWRTISY